MSSNWGRGVNYSKIFGGRLSANASIHYPGQPEYNTTTVQRWSTWAEPTFAVTIKPVTDGDIRTANKYNLTFLATGGGHGGETGFTTENVLDLETNTLTLAVGNAFCVNMTGATIGAGVGPYQVLHGLVIDALRSVRLVTASGDIVTASDEENPDLFWAVRGAGANFGIITSATYEIFNAPNNGNVVLAEFAYPGSVNGSLWRLLESWEGTYTKEMGLTMSASYDQKTGTIDQLLPLNPTQWRDVTLPLSQVSQNSGFGTGASVCATGKYNNHPSVGAKHTSASTYIDVFNQYVEIMKARPWLTSALIVQRFNTTATLAVPESKRGVYPRRDFSSLIILENYYDGPRHDADIYRFSKKLRTQLVSTSGFGSLQTYVNYAHGDHEGPEVWYGKDNSPRLVQLKRQWDPEGKFGPGNPIPLA
ncbi:hypothetical protein BDV23DRAFT_171897 [Aspergillus alliaceus]|uniref:Berberine/berberine-like domain-containing protein n=1 Tax=Petromyces alliaceus TaxID=209559 RepID=A0A5N7CBL4_PETAA|nr:hypothetical protein BDV23DRAFT_171897 [Aspergillus alliaceus]